MPPGMVLVIHQLNAKTREVSKVATAQQGKNNPNKTGGGGGLMQDIGEKIDSHFGMGQGLNIVDIL